MQPPFAEAALEADWITALFCAIVGRAGGQKITKNNQNFGLCVWAIRAYTPEKMLCFSWVVQGLALLHPALCVCILHLGNA